jgi:hypothetical protein
MSASILERVRMWAWKYKYRPGRVFTKFIAKDIRREIEIVETPEITQGVVTGRTRTWNVLYAAKGIKPQPPFGDVQRLKIKHLWDWAGEPSGGPVPD